MKAAVMKIEGSRALIIDEEGVVSYIDNEGYSIGEELLISGRQEDSFIDKVMDFAKKNMPVMAAAATFLVLFSGGLAYANIHSCSTVTLDINPSLRYSLNVFDKVVEVGSFNEDGEEIVSGIGDEARGKKIGAVVEITLDELDRTGYVGEDTSVVVTLGSRTHSEEELENKVVDSVNDWNRQKAEEGQAKSIDVETVKVTPEMADMAARKNVSPGKIYIVGKLKDEVLEGVEFDEDDWYDKSVREIKEATKSVSDQKGVKNMAEAVTAASDNLTHAKAGSSSSGSTQKEAAVKTTAKAGGKSKKKKTAKTDNTASANTTLSADEVGQTVTGSGAGGSAVSGNEAAAVSENAVVTEEVPALIQPTVSSQPVTEETVLPEVTETVTSPEAVILQIDQPAADSSYLDAAENEDMTCDSIPQEDL